MQLEHIDWQNEGNFKKSSITLSSVITSINILVQGLPLFSVSNICPDTKFSNKMEHKHTHTHEHMEWEEVVSVFKYFSLQKNKF